MATVFFIFRLFELEFAIREVPQNFSLFVLNFSLFDFLRFFFTFQVTLIAIFHFPNHLPDVEAPPPTGGLARGEGANTKGGLELLHTLDRVIVHRYYSQMEPFPFLPNISRQMGLHGFFLPVWTGSWFKRALHTLAGPLGRKRSVEGIFVAAVGWDFILGVAVRALGGMKEHFQSVDIQGELGDERSGNRDDQVGGGWYSVGAVEAVAVWYVVHNWLVQVGFITVFTFIILLKDILNLNLENSLFNFNKRG